MTTIRDFIESSEYADAVDRFKALICDLIDEGVDPDTITDALISLGFGTRA